MSRILVLSAPLPVARCPLHPMLGPTRAAQLSLHFKTQREWLSRSFSIADILMADVLRLVDRFDGLAAHPSCRDYVVRATARPSFVKAYADQMAHLLRQTEQGCSRITTGDEA
jgi:hypothetical protein